MTIHQGATYAERREAFYATLRGTFWPEVHGRENALFTTYPIPREEVTQIRETAKRVYSIYKKMAKLLRNASDDTLLRLDFPQNTLRYVRQKTTEAETIIGRVDLVKRQDGRYVVLELNSDTPTFIKELFFVNELVCKAFGVEDPNRGQRNILATAMKKAIRESYHHIGGTGSPYVVFSSHREEESKEDYFTARFLMSLVEDEFDCDFVPLCDLRVKRDGLYDLKGRKIDVWYRQTYPIEHLCRDQDKDGTPVGEWILDHVIHKSLAILNPPSAFLMQSKAVQAAIWALHEHRIYFSREEHEWIEQHFLPTYLEPDRFIETGTSYVKKPAFGREGDTVEIFLSNGSVIREAHRSYEQSMPVYQQYVDMPKTSVESLNGWERCHLLMGCHVIGGEPSAIGIRAGDEITGNLSYYLPVCIAD
ncbi:MAG: glutathionylspermidine synthase family protein [Alicyclobacillus macrosporangiidus]|uniref:glutathionylspermidine synthase family protein n=1 Tax=Alicyclobacillus macrosporangiidus TaxID=392015 RepID=UPI0026EDAD2E|nr:glutathionylspermidine synthase family protein [Alicyclobacillus macrosporangiidus]MCL6599420.1 glutathionylspermidine synthase family protein [Alicyclobacillus macrosporangiidus]